MRGRRSLSMGVLVVILVVALASLGMGYALWSKTLTIEGTVNTGEVNAEFSIEEVDEGYGGYLHDDGINEDKEIGGKDIAECMAELITAVPPDLENAGSQWMKVTITEAYPSFECFVNFNVHNNGTIPIKLHLPELKQVSPGLDVHFETPIHSAGTCYFNEVNGVWDGGTPDPHPQLEPSDVTYCTAHIHVLQEAAQGTTLTFMAEIFAHQWNEEPAP